MLILTTAADSIRRTRDLFVAALTLIVASSLSWRARRSSSRVVK